MIPGSLITVLSSVANDIVVIDLFIGTADFFFLDKYT